MNLSNLQCYTGYQQSAYRFYLWLLISALAFIVASPVFAAGGLQPFPLAEKEMEKSQQLDQHLFATGRIQNKGGESFPESWLSLSSGRLNQTLYRIRSTRDTDEILEHYQVELQRSGSEILFQCSSRECGSSNDWANRVFKVSTLYGEDREQHYVAARRELNGQADYVSVYITERGTGRIYVYVTHYQVEAAPVTTKGVKRSLYEDLIETGWVRLPVSADGSFEDSVFGQLQQLAVQLERSDKRFWLVAHHYGKQSDEILQQRSEQAVARLQRSFEQLGLSADKLELKGLGALAPTKDSVAYGGRIELIVKK
ncbi:DUF4892 domain-containing protein [Oceanospirillum sp.]|uniref:DUF4892 domain-containing protein n=1 Tax=Oceanospirillum sp. TaxID=2021254 RepID=UPI003A90AAB6